MDLLENVTTPSPPPKMVHLSSKLKVLLEYPLPEALFRALEDSSAKQKTSSTSSGGGEDDVPLIAEVARSRIRSSPHEGEGCLRRPSREILALRTSGVKRVSADDMKVSI